MAGEFAESTRHTLNRLFREDAALLKHFDRNAGDPLPDEKMEADTLEELKPTVHSKPIEDEPPLERGGYDHWALLQTEFLSTMDAQIFRWHERERLHFDRPFPERCAFLAQDGKVLASSEWAQHENNLAKDAKTAYPVMRFGPSLFPADNEEQRNRRRTNMSTMLENGKGWP